jgi:4,5-dihydroxyphthalate decarboxylase
MADLNLTLACGPFDRTQALRDGTVKPEGIELTYLALEPAEIFYRMINYREFDVSEMSITNYATLVSLGESPFVAIPVFPSRVFRHGSFFINTASGIRTPADLKGKRGGVVEYRQTAGVYMRGILQHEYGVKPADVQWVQARPDRLGRNPPADVTIATAPPGSQPGELIERGEIDFLLSASPPVAFQRGSPRVARLFPNYRELEQDYYRRTKIYPIMHLIVIRKDVHERHPWAALSLYKAFCAAKDHCMRELLHAGAPRVSFAWLAALIEQERSIIGKDWYPYGVENPAAIEALMQYMEEQGLIARRPTVAELFVASTLRPVPVDEGHAR